MSGTAPVQTSLAYITNVLSYGPPLYPRPLMYLRQLSDQQLCEIAVLVYAGEELGIRILHTAFPDRLLVPIQHSQIPLDKLQKQLITQVRNVGLQYQFCEGTRLFPVLLTYLIVPENYTSAHVRCISANLKAVLMDNRVSSLDICTVLRKVNLEHMMRGASPVLCTVPAETLSRNNIVRYVLNELGRCNYYNLFTELLWSHFFDAEQGIDGLASILKRKQSEFRMP